MPEPSHLSELDEFTSILAQQQPEEGQLDPEAMAKAALAYVVENLKIYPDETLAEFYTQVVGEICDRDLEEEILGEVPDAASISLDEEMNEMIKLVKKMRSNLSRQTTLGRQVSNREIRETLSACVTTMKALTSHQKAVRTLERQRLLESTLIEILGELQQGLQVEFQTRFRARLEEISQ